MTDSTLEACARALAEPEGHYGPGAWECLPRIMQERFVVEAQVVLRALVAQVEETK